MTTPFAFGEHSYSFEKHGSEYVPIRDDNARPWSTYRSYIVKDEQALPCVHAYSPCLSTVRECVQLITGDLQGMTTSVHRIVWAVTVYDARRIREQEDIDRASKQD